MLGLMKTSAKLKVSFYQLLGDRFGIPDAPNVPSLPHLVRLAAALTPWDLPRLYYRQPKIAPA